MSDYQFCLILALLFSITSNVVESDFAAVLGWLLACACGLAALVWCFLERKQ